MTLPKKLRRRIKGYKNAHKRKNKKIYGDSIELRPAAVNDRTGVGHWEGDLVKGIRLADEPALMTLTECTAGLRSSSRLLTIMRTPALKPCRTRSTTTGPRNLRVSLLTMVPSLPSYQRLLEPRFTSHIRTRLGSVAQTRTPMDCLGNSSRKGSLSEQLLWLKFKQSNPH